MELTREPGAGTITADGYQVRVRDGVPAAVVADPNGQAWTRLMLLASVNRTDLLDESHELGPVTLTETTAGGEHVIDVECRAKTVAWQGKSVRLRCFGDRIEFTAHVEGRGRLGTVQVLGGRALLRSGACGTFRSSIEFASVFDPQPTEPIQVVRSPLRAATLGVIGGAGPGRRHATFAPPPLCVAFGRERAASPTGVPGGDWLALSVVGPVDTLRFTELRYLPEDAGYLLELDYDAHTDVSGTFVTPTVVIRPAADPREAISAYQRDHVRRGFVPAHAGAPAADWWSEPIFCGWGAQCARAAATTVGDVIGDVAGRAGELSRQDGYDEWLHRLAEHAIVPGTVVVDDRWQVEYGTAEPDRSHWPDLRGWIGERHAAGQHVLLWWKAWDPAGLGRDECVVTPTGVPLAADPGSPAYQEHLAHLVTNLLGPQGLDADGLKIDFLQRSPAGRSLRRPGATEDAPWGIAALHALLATIYHAAKAAKPDALIMTHAAHPAFHDVTDMVRLNDLLVVDEAGAAVAPVAQLVFRRGVVSNALPDHLIDTDQWPIGDRVEWRAYVTEQARLGVPSLYYAEHLHYPEYVHYAERIDRVGDALCEDDLAVVARTWQEYRFALRGRKDLA